MFPFRLFLDVHAIPFKFIYVIKTQFLSFSWQFVSLNLPSFPSAQIWASWWENLGAPFFATGMKFKSCAETLTQTHPYTIIKTQRLSPFPASQAIFKSLGSYLDLLRMYHYVSKKKKTFHLLLANVYVCACVTSSVSTSEPNFESPSFLAQWM